MNRFGTRRLAGHGVGAGRTGSGTGVWPIRAARWVALVTSVMFALSAATAAFASTGHGHRSARPGSKRLVLQSQTSWVRPGGTFSLRVASSGGPPLAALDVSASVFPPVVNRSELSLVFGGQEQAPQLASGPPTPARNLTSGSSVTLRVGVGSPPGTGAPPLVSVPPLPPCGGVCDGVYPLLVQFSQPGTGSVVASLTTEILVSGPAYYPLHFSWVLPISSPPRVGAEGAPAIAVPEIRQLNSEATAIASAGSAPVLAPDPTTLAAISSSSSGRSRAATSLLQKLSSIAGRPGQQVLPEPLALLDPTSLAQAHLAASFAAKLALGQQLERAVLKTAPAPGTWVSGPGFRRDGLALLPSASANLVLTPNDLVSQNSNLTPDRPFAIAGRPGMRGLVSDPGLASLLPKGPSDAVLAAHQVLATLAQIYFESPNDPVPRGVVLAVPAGWKANAAFLSSFAKGLSASPVVSTVNLTTLFSLLHVPPDSAPRHLRNAQGRSPVAGFGAVTAQRRLDALSSMAASPYELLGMQQSIAVAESPLATGKSRTNSLAVLARLEHAMVGGMAIAGDQTLTLTARTGRVPLTIASPYGGPLVATVTVASDKLAFPSGSSQVVRLLDHNATVTFLVKARTAGDSPLEVRVFSPKGHLLVIERRLTVRVTAVSVVALLLTLGAVLFLLVWWLRSMMRGRRSRNRNLVPAAGQPPE